MSLKHIQPSQLNGLNAPEIEEMTPTAAADFNLGAPVQRNAGAPGTIEEFSGGATVTGLLGFALQACDTGEPDFGTKVQVAKANRQTRFLGQVYDSGGGAVATVSGDGTYLGNDYGLVKVSDDWYVDEDDTTHVVVTVVKELSQLNAVLFEVIDTAIGE